LYVTATLMRTKNKLWLNFLLSTVQLLDDI